MEELHVIELLAENVKRLSAVKIRPDGAGVIVVGGDNDAGKSSVVDSIAYALGGKALMPEEPLRRGAKRGRVRVDLGKFVVTRTFTESGGGTVTVENPEGLTHRSPQALLDSLIGELTFDPAAFARMKPAEQLETLKSVAGLDTTALDAERAEVYARRTALNAEVRRLRAVVEAMPTHDGVPEEELSVGALATQIEEARAHERAYQKLESREQATDARVGDLCLKKAELENQIKSMQDALTKLTETLHTAKNLLGDLQRERRALPYPDTETLIDTMRGIEKTNQEVRDNRERTITEGQFDAAVIAASGASEIIAEIDQKKAAAISEADFPIEGLGVSDVGVTFEGFPLEQASQSGRMRVSVAMGFALNPKLKILLIRDGSLLDEGNLSLICEMAQEAGGQVWIERVGHGDECSVIIEDGAIQGAEKGETNDGDE